MKQTNASEDDIVSLVREHVQRMVPRDRLTLIVTHAEEPETDPLGKFDASISVIRILDGKPMWVPELAPEGPEQH